MNKIPVFLVTGFLGSGKTTFISNIIDFYAKEKKVGIVQNEFAPANFDGKELKRHSNNNFELMEINNGSVFCVCLLSNFITSLSAFSEKYNPDLLFIESSGLSDPIAIGQLFESPVLKPKLLFSGSICIVDAKNYFKLLVLQKRIEHQVKIADIIIINKTENLKIIDKNIEEEISKINPFAKIYQTSYCKLNVEEAIHFISDPLSYKISIENPQLESAGRPDINSAVLRTVTPLKNENIDNFLQSITSQSIRLKGYIKTDNKKIYAVQASYSEYNTEKIENNGNNQTEIIVMSEEINARTLSNIYKSFC